jgi:peroxiredoxin/outer membrane lipoprotein-sorting protein
MKRSLVVITAIVMLHGAARKACPAQLSAQQIVDKVAETYSRLRSYQVEVVQDASTAAGGYSAGVSEGRYDLAFEAPGKVRLKVETSGLDLLVVSDGQTTWWYLPDKRTYTQVAAAATLPASGQGEENEDLAARAEQSLVGRYARLTVLASGAVLKQEDHLKVSGQKVRCYVVELHQGGDVHRLWIDEERFLVLRHKEVIRSVQNGRESRTEIQTDVKRVELGAPPAGLFVFTPPPKAREVKVLGIPGERVNLAGMPAGEFTLKDTNGEKVSLSDYRGKVVLLDFWATWCPPCREELPRINTLYHQLKGKDLVVLGVNDEDAGTIRGFLKKHDYELPTLVDSKRVVHKMYGVRAIPTLVIINRTGVVVADFVGERSEQELLAALRTAGISI